MGKIDSQNQCRMYSENGFINDELLLKGFVDKIDYMLLNHKYEFANDTLASIKHYIKQHGKISDRQAGAVENIYNSVSTKRM